MAYDPHKGHAALRRGRCSQPGAEYFLTVCTDGKRTRSAIPYIAKAILDETHAMSTDATWTVQSVIVMPDHIHLLITLGERLSLPKAVQRLKAKTSAVLHSANLGWERGFFDRQLRPDDDRLAIFLYIYLNPYRANLCMRSDRWPWYYCQAEDWVWFQHYLEMDRPPPEWLVM